MHHKKNFGQKIMPWFIVMLLVLSILGVMTYGFGGQQATQTQKYKDYKFKKIENRWILESDRGYLVFDYLPQQVEDIEIDKDIINRFTGIEIDTTFSLDDPYSKAIALTIYELNKAFQKENMFIRQGLSEENEYNFPVIDCEDATEIIPVVKFKEANESKITAQKNCIIIEANSAEEFLRIKDRILFGHYNILE